LAALCALLGASVARLLGALAALAKPLAPTALVPPCAEGASYGFSCKARSAA